MRRPGRRLSTDGNPPAAPCLLCRVSGSAGAKGRRVREPCNPCKICISPLSQFLRGKCPETFNRSVFGSDPLQNYLHLPFWVPNRRRYFKRRNCFKINRFGLVGAEGFEPPTPCSQSRNPEAAEMFEKAGFSFQRVTANPVETCGALLSFGDLTSYKIIYSSGMRTSEILSDIPQSI